MMFTLVIQEMSKQFPNHMDTLVHERDQLVLSIAYNVLSPPNTHKHTNIILLPAQCEVYVIMLLKVARERHSGVAVVGKGHLPGIKKNWKQPIESLSQFELLTHEVLRARVLPNLSFVSRRL